MRLTIEMREPSSLVPYEHNSKKHPQSQIDMLVASIQRFGFNDPIAVTAEGVIVEGHGRLMAAHQLGLDSVPVIVLPEGMTNDKIDLYRIAHNKTALNSTFDFTRLVEQLREIMGETDVQFLTMGFDRTSVEALFNLHGGGDIPVSGAGAGVTGDAPEERTFEVVWESKEERDRFAAVMEKVKATYGGSSASAMLAMLREAQSGELLPATAEEPAATAENVGKLAW